MAVVKQNIKAKLRITDDKHKTLCTFNNVDPEVSETSVSNFAEGIDSLRKDSVGFKVLITEADLVLED